MTNESNVSRIGKDVYALANIIKLQFHYLTSMCNQIDSNEMSLFIIHHSEALAKSQSFQFPFVAPVNSNRSLVKREEKSTKISI